MAFQPRVFDTILMDMIAHVRMNSTLTDFSVGSVVRTLLEAAALEDDEQYHQMVQLLDDFRFTKAIGTGLDERASDFNVIRYEATRSVGSVVYRNESLIKNVESFDTLAGTASLILDDTSDFPVSGYPYTVRIGEGTANVEDVTVTNNSVAASTLTLSPVTTKPHSSGDRVSYVTGTDLTISASVQVQVPASADASPIIYEVLDKATIVAGDYESTTARIRCTQTGSIGNVGPGRITQFTGSSPFTGASVTNLSNTSGGRDRETDDEFRIRLKSRLTTLSRGTINSIESLVKGVTDLDTGQQVISANLVEDFVNYNNHILYIDDGTGFIPSKVDMASSSLNTGGGSLPIGSGTLPVVSSTEFPSSGFVLVSPSNPIYAELLEYTSKTVGVLTLSGLTTKTHANGDSVLLVDVMDAEEGQNYFQLSNYPIQKNSYQIYDNNSGQYELKVEQTQYFLNRTNGNTQIYGAGLSSGAKVLGHYNYYTGLVAIAQKVINGDKNDPVNYPGIVSAGVIIHVGTPVIRPITIVMSISVENGFVESEVRDQVKVFVESYINGLFIGQNVILSKMIQRAMSITGVSNAKVLIPTTDLVIFENELARSYDSSGASLVTVL